jgi:hypothetical protein
VVDLGTLNWKYGEFFGGSGLMSFYTFDISDANFANASTTPKALTHFYKAINPTSASQGEYGITLYTASGGSVVVNDSSYSDATTFKAAMSGVMLVYELATPTTEDISDILPADNYIGVEGGGTLTFKNEYEYDVPSNVTFVTKGASA